MKWQGVWVAVVTPFRGGKVDVGVIDTEVNRLLEAGVSGLVPCGTTGEGASLDDREFAEVVTAVLKRAKGRVPVVPGTGSNHTGRTIERTGLAKSLGADGALVVTPYYVRPTQEGMRRHFGAVSEKVDLPLILYNVPSRTAVNLLPETVERIASEARIRGIKDCAPLPQIGELIHRVGGKISVLSGEDSVFLPFLSIGGDGIISVAANLIPKPWVEIFEAFRRKDLDQARGVFLKYARLCEALFVEPNPVPLKAAMEAMGWILGELRLPLAPISEKNRAGLLSEMKLLGLEGS